MSKATVLVPFFGGCGVGRSDERIFDEGLRMLFKAELLTIGDDRRSALTGVSVAIRAKESRVTPLWRVLVGGW